MIIFLDQSLIGCLANNPSPYNPTAITVDLVAEAVRQGTHLIFAEVATFDALIAFSNIFNKRT